MLREKFAEIIENALINGYSRGMDVFLENLEIDLQKTEVIKEHGVETIVESIMENVE